MNGVNSMGVAFYVAAFLVGSSCVIYTFIQNRTDKLQKKIYLAMVMLLVLNTVTETVIEVLNPSSTLIGAAYVVLSFCKYLYFLTHTAMLALLGYYVLSLTGKLARYNFLRNLLFLMPILLVELLMLTNPIHHWCYYYEFGTLVYHRNWGVTVLYVASAFYILFFIVTLFSSWKAMTAKRKIAMSYFLFMVIAGILIQMVFIEIRVELFAEALAYLGLLLAVEDEGDLLSTDVGVYNRKALQIDLDNLLLSRLSFHIICLKIENADMIRRVTGTSNTGILSVMVVKELVRFVPRYSIYQTSPDTFVITLIRENDEESVRFAKDLSERFEKSWRCQHSDIMLQATVMLVRMPEDIARTEEVFNMADGLLPNDHEKCLIGKENLGYLLRRRAVESAIQRGLAKGNFEVYYQPTFDAKELKIEGAEALIRLHDGELGDLYPDEFIPIAEQIGLIGDVDDFVLRSVCRYLSEGTPQKLGIRSINVNLSVLQCVKPGFFEHELSIVDEYCVLHSSVNFEITESVNSEDYKVTKSVIRSFKDAGFKIYMDDYGTGYSNMMSLFSMDFDVIKIDKSILWGAEKSALGMTILENSIRMLKEMHFGIQVEGVETEAEIELLQKLGVDHLQGYYFSRPVSVKKLEALLKR